MTSSDARAGVPEFDTFHRPNYHEEMKVILFLALCCICGPLAAQVGAKADEIVVPKSFGTSLVLHHCEALEVKTDGIKVKHDEGTYVVPVGNLPEAWKKWVVDKNAAQQPGQKEVKPGSGENFNWKTLKPEDGAEILRVRVVAAWGESLVVELLKNAPPLTGVSSPSGYNLSGTMVVLSGTVPLDAPDNQMYTVLAKKGDTRKFQGKTLQAYQVSHFEKGIVP